MTKIYTPKLKPKKHQETGVVSMLQTNMANFDDQGLGKCKQAYDLAGKLFEKDEIDLMIMVSKSSLRENFFLEVSNDAQQLIVKVARGNKQERRMLYRYPSYHILVLSYESVISDIDDLLKLVGAARTLLCLDEAHYIKNSKAERSKACLRLSENAKKTAIFTGTPIPNKIEDIYTQLKFLGHDVGNDLKEFKERFGNLNEFKSYLNNSMIRRKKEKVTELNLPSKKVIFHPVKLSTEEMRMYESAVSDFMISFKNKKNVTAKVSINGILAQLTRLSQLVSNPSLLLPNYDLTKSKIKKLDEIVSKTVKKDEKIIIWTNYRHNVKELLLRYKEYGATTIYGDNSKEEIQQNVKAFKENPNVKVLIAIPACAREGFTLTVASKAVYLDRNFSLLDWIQSQDRIHRISQTKECEIHVIVAKNTLDERINDILDRKSHIQQFLLGDIDQYQGIENLTIPELEKILKGNQD